MPWDVFQSGDQHCVHKLDAMGKKGKRMKCYDNAADAQAYKNALYAHMNPSKEQAEGMAELYFNIPLGALPQLVELQNLLRRKLTDRNATFNDPATFHVTLVYVEDDKGVESLNFDDLASDLPIFGVGGDVIDNYADDSTSKVAIGLSLDRSPQLQYLQAAIYYRAQAAGMKISQFSYPNRYKPHITMASIEVQPGQSAPYVYLPSPIMMQVNNFVLTGGDSFEPLNSWALRTDVPVQELVDKHMPNMESRVGLDIREQVTEENGHVQIEWTVVGEMKGGFPNIPLPADVDVKSLQEQGRKFVTLPIGQVNAKSRNGRTYTRPAIEQMVQQINDKRPEGGWGHIPDDQMATMYGPPAVRWLASQIDHEGVVWAKALPLTSESAKYFDDARLTNARVGTSLHAFVGMEGQDVQTMELIRLDLADPARVGVPITAATAALSSEMAAGTLPKTEEAAPSKPIVQPINSQESAPMADNNDVRVVELQTEKRTLETEIDKLNKEKKRLEGVESDAKEMASILGLDPKLDVVKAARLLKEQYDEMKAEATKLLDKAMLAQVAELVKVEDVRPIVLEMVRDQKPFTEKALTRAIDDVLGRESIKKLLAAGLTREMGEAQKPPPGTRQSPPDPKKAEDKWLEPLPEGAKPS